MARTIKELADNYVKTLPQVNSWRCYVMGANSALDEIKQFMEDCPSVNLKSYKAILGKIKQLKGE